MSGTYRGVKIERSTILFTAVFLLLSLVIFLLLSLVTYGAKSSQEIQITNDPDDQYSPRISGSYVVWVDTRNGNEDIYGFNLETGQEFQITDDLYDQTHPSISGSYVVWEDDRNGNAAIRKEPGSVAWLLQVQHSVIHF
jgi:beta propeller repeat protein